MGRNACKSFRKNVYCLVLMVNCHKTISSQDGELAFFQRLDLKKCKHSPEINILFKHYQFLPYCFHWVPGLSGKVEKFL